MPTENFTKLENLDKNSEIESQVKEELTNLGISVKEFYEVNQDKVDFKTEVVKEYFNKLKDDANIKGKTSKESWQYLVSDNKRFTTCVMAMQIALESMGYEIQKIDGRLGKNTKVGIKRFQTQCGLSLKDGLPGQETIVKLCEALANPTAFEAKQENKPATVKASSSSSSSGGSGNGGTPASTETTTGSENNEQPFLGKIKETLKKAGIEDDYNKLSDEEKKKLSEGQKVSMGDKYEYQRSFSPSLNGFHLSIGYLKRIEKGSNEEEIFKDGKREKKPKDYEGNIPEGYAKTVESHIKELFSSLPDLGGTDTVITSVIGSKLYLKSKNSIKGGLMYRFPEVEINLRKCVDSNGNFLDDRIKSEVVPNAIKKLKDKKKALIASDQIRSRKYTKSDIFSGTSLNSFDETLVNNYFAKFSNNTLEFNDDSVNDTGFDITGDNANVRLRFDDSGSDEKYNKWNSNSDLIFSGSEIVNDDFKLDDKKVKNKLKDIILKIIKRDDFK